MEERHREKVAVTLEDTLGLRVIEGDTDLERVALVQTEREDETVDEGEWVADFDGLGQADNVTALVGEVEVEKVIDGEPEAVEEVLPDAWAKELVGDPEEEADGHTEIEEVTLLEKVNEIVGDSEGLGVDDIDTDIELEGENWEEGVL